VRPFKELTIGHQGAVYIWQPLAFAGLSASYSNARISAHWTIVQAWEEFT
jgi:hypothetical protein